MPSANRTKPNRERRRWLQFSLRTLLIAILLVSLPLSWLAARLQRKSAERNAVAAIQAANGWVTYDFEDDYPVGASLPTPEFPGPEWLRRLLGPDFFVNVIEVTSSNSKSASELLEHLAAFPRLERLRLDWCQVSETGISDAGLKHLGSLAKLRKLNVALTRVTEDEVHRFRLALPGCFATYSTLPDETAKPPPLPNGASFRSDAPSGGGPFTPSDATGGDPFGRPSL